MVAFVVLATIAGWEKISKILPFLHFKTIHERVHSVESDLVSDRSLHTECHEGFEKRISEAAAQREAFQRWMKVVEIGSTIVNERLDNLEKSATMAATVEAVQQLTGQNADLDRRLNEHRMWVGDLQSDLRDWKKAAGIEFDKLRTINAPEPPPDCIGVIYRRKWNNEAIWVADVTNMMNTTLANTTARIRFVNTDGKEITRPNSSWIVDEHRGPEGDRTHSKQADSVTLAMGERYPFELVLSNANENGTYCATRTADLTVGEWEARISLISGSDVVDGIVRFTIFPDNDLEWERRKFVLRRKS